MKKEMERRLLQACVALGCVVPFLAGAAGVLRGPAFLKGVGAGAPVDLDSHFRYLSGLLLGLGLAFAACIPVIERRGSRFRTLGLIVLVGAFSRLLSAADRGLPSAGHLFGLVMELAVVPFLLLWQWRVERRFAAPEARTS